MILIEVLWCVSTVTATFGIAMMLYLYKSYDDKFYDDSLRSLIEILDLLSKERIELASHQKSSELKE
jgi:hypothetical protein